MVLSGPTLMQNKTPLEAILNWKEERDRIFMTRPLRVYMAGRYRDLDKLAGEREKFRSAGIEVTSTWLDNAEEGMAFQDVAVIDLEDVDRADVLVLYTEPYGTPVPGGGRHVEFGYALGRGKECVLVGPLENIFHWHPTVKSFPVTEYAIRYLERYKEERNNVAA